MSESLLDKTRRMIEGLREAKFVEGMEEFYADDAINEEATGAKIEGKANIIVDDIIYFFEPMFQDGIVAQAVDQVVANHLGYVTRFPSIRSQEVPLRLNQ